VVDDMVMLVTGVTGGAMVLACFVVGDVPMLVIGEVWSPYCHIGEARKSMQEPNNGGRFPTRCINERSRRPNNMPFFWPIAHLERACAFFPQTQ
jgi:hypothetical protein